LKNTSLGGVELDTCMDKVHNNIEKIIIDDMGCKLNEYVKLFNDLKQFYDDPANTSIKALFSMNLELFFSRIKIYDKNKDIFTELTNCDYMK
jgi:hypothetical protein